MPDYAFEGEFWANTNITWSIATLNFSDQPGGAFSNSISDPIIISDITTAFARWDAVSNLSFTRVFTDASNVNIRIGYGNIDGQGDTIGLANYTYNSSTHAMSAATIRFDIAENYFTQGGEVYLNSTNTPLTNVALHEIGHALGLDHVNASVIMNPIASPLLTLQPGDIQGIQLLYGGGGGGDDFAGNSGTAGMVSPGGSVAGQLGTLGDRDWFRVQLNAGTSYTIEVGGQAGGLGTLSDPFLRLYNSSSQLLTSTTTQVPAPTFCCRSRPAQRARTSSKRQPSTTATPGATRSGSAGPQRPAAGVWNTWAHGATTNDHVVRRQRRPPRRSCAVLQRQRQRRALEWIDVRYLEELGVGYCADDSVVDVNGDSLADLIQFYNGRALVALSTGNGFAAWNQWTTGATSTDHVVDVNGDHRGDIVQFYNGRAFVALSNGSSFGSWGSWASGITAEDHVVDVNGDGLADLVQLYNSRALVALSTGTGFSSWSQWGTGVTATDQVVDVNGDNRADLVQFFSGRAIVALSNGLNFGPWSDWATGVTPSDQVVNVSERQPAPTWCSFTRDRALVALSDQRPGAQVGLQNDFGSCDRPADDRRLVTRVKRTTSVRNPRIYRGSVSRHAFRGTSPLVSVYGKDD